MIACFAHPLDILLLEHPIMKELKTDILIVGGGTGGVAAAIAAASRGHRVILTEEFPWLGGQLTSQAVPPDENPWIETGGGTLRYRQYRTAVQQYYRDHLPLTAKLRSTVNLNPGGGGVSRLCHDPRIGAAVIDQMLAPARASGKLTILQPAKPIAADTQGDRITGVTIEHLQTGQKIHITSPYVIDATELGDLLALSNTEYVSGAESRKDTGEMHALDGPAEPDNVQALTWVFAMGFDPDSAANHTIDKPATYDFWRNYVPPVTPPWSGKLLSWTDVHPVTLTERRNRLFEEDPAWTDGRINGNTFWRYRRIQTPSHYDTDPQPHGVTIVNWPMNDYMEGNIIDKPADQVARHLEAARQLSLSLLYWVQTEAPNATTGKQGYPGMYLRPDFTGTPDGLAQAPYIRESRRIKAVFTVTEAHVGSEMRWSRKEPFDAITGRGFDPVQGPICEYFDDSVGIGYYAIDLHPSGNGRNYVDVASTPFQIPLGALLPVRVKNLLPGCKNLGVTHITNGCYRLHPVEWNIGESAGLLASFCLEQGKQPHQVRENKQTLRDYQAVLENEGVMLNWPWQRNPRHG
jgi:hypothetical protein